MKKFLALVMAMMMILAMGTVAFADEVNAVTYTPTTKATFNTIDKTYTSENNVVVNETLTFTSTADGSNPDGGTAKLTVAELKVDSLKPGTLTVTIPSLSVAGIYKWTITETPGNTAGVTYSNDTVHVIVLVGYDNEKHALEILETEYYIKNENDTKTYELVNTFNSGSFSVEKEVTGNMANENDKFEITVTLTSTKPIGTTIDMAGNKVAPSAWTEVNGTWTYSSTMNYSKAGGAKTFSDIPVGVTVTVVENTNDDMMHGYKQVSITGNGELTITDATNAEIVVTNNKNATIETGISMDNAPYMMIMALVVLAGAAMLLKKRAYND